MTPFDGCEVARSMTERIVVNGPKEHCHRVLSVLFAQGYRMTQEYSTHSEFRYIAEKEIKEKEPCTP